MSIVVILTRSGWDEPPRIRHEVARALSCYYRVIYVETPVCWKVKYKTEITAEVEPNITRCRLSNRYALPVKIQHYLPFAHAWSDRKQAKELVKTLSAITEGEVFLINFNYDSVEVMKSAFFKLKIYLCNDDFVAAVSNSISRWIVKYRQRNVAKNADFCLAVSQPLVDLLKEYNPETKLFLPGHDLKWNKTGGKKKAERKENQKIKVGFMGYIEASLETEWLAQASRQPDMEVHLVGPEGSNCDHLRRNSRYIFFHGPKYGQEMYDLLNEMDVLVVPYNISFKHIQAISVPNKLFKYLAVGKPVIISDMPHFIDFGYGFIYRAYSKESFVDQIRKAYQEDNDKLRDSRKKIAAENSWERRGGELFDMIGGYLKDCTGKNM